jgi:hypothetical protein
VSSRQYKFLQQIGTITNFQRQDLSNWKIEQGGDHDIKNVFENYFVRIMHHQTSFFIAQINTKQNSLLYRKSARN